MTPYLVVLSLFFAVFPATSAITQRPKQATIVISPGTVSLQVGAAQQFLATTTGTTKLPVWSATGGSITQSGRFVAGTVPGTYLVTAALPANVKSIATVTITPSLDTTAPTIPTNLTASLVTMTSFDVGWSPSTDAVGVVGYGVYVNGLLVSVSIGAGTSLSGLLCNTATTVLVDAADAAGNRSAQASITVTTLPCAPPPPDTTPPTPPTNLAATPQQTTIGLTWTASTDTTGVVGYGIYLNGALNSSVTGTLGAVAGLACAQSYIVAVDAVDLAGNRSTKAALSVQTLACTPPVPTPTTLVFTIPTDYATNVTSCTVELRRGGDALTALPVATRDIGKPAPVGGDVSSDISTLVDPLPTGSYYAMVVAVGPGGSTPSAPSAVFTK